MRKRRGTVSLVYCLRSGASLDSLVDARNNVPMPATTRLTLGDYLEAAACSLPGAQRQMDRLWRADLEQFELAVTASGEWAGMAALAAPRRMSIAQTEIAVEFTIERERSSEMQLHVNLINLGFERKFAQSSFQRQKISVTVAAHSHPKETRHG